MKQISIYSLAVNILSILLLLGNTIYLIVVWNSLPDQIPGHYDFAGNVTRYDGKGSLLAVPIINVILFLSMSLVERFPQIWNTGVRVTEENKVRVYLILKNMLVTIKLSIVIAFVYLSINQTLESGLTGWFMGIFLFLIFAPTVFFGVKLIKAR